MVLTPVGSLKNVLESFSKWSWLRRYFWTRWSTITWRMTTHLSCCSHRHRHPFDPGSLSHGGLLEDQLLELRRWRDESDVAALLDDPADPPVEVELLEYVKVVTDVEGDGHSANRHLLVVRPVVHDVRFDGKCHRLLARHLLTELKNGPLDFDNTMSWCHKQVLWVWKALV